MYKLNIDTYNHTHTGLFNHINHKRIHAVTALGAAFTHTALVE